MAKFHDMSFEVLKQLHTRSVQGNGKAREEVLGEQQGLCVPGVFATGQGHHNRRPLDFDDGIKGSQL